MTYTPVTAEEIEERRQALFGYRRDEQGEIVEGDLMWDPSSVEAKQVMEEARLRLFGYARNFQGKIVETLEEALETGVQHQARLGLGGLDCASVSWRYSTGLWTVACKTCGQPLYQERGNYPQERLIGEDAAANALREHRARCRQRK